MSASLPEEVLEVVHRAIDDEGMHVLVEGWEGYDDARRVKNARFDRRPAIIVGCESAGHVKWWFDEALEVPELAAMAFVVRSGGHQHEGRSADGGAVVLDLSRICDIDVDRGGRTLTVGPGAALGAVEKKVGDALVLPVGLCASVRAGGLLQGGGWGTSWRHVGMTIDKLLGVELVTVDGVIRSIGPHASPGSIEADLWWAIRGGGGGNFGVVTEMRFALTDRAAEIPFAVEWDVVEARSPVARAWGDLMRGDDWRIDSFCRLGMVEDGLSPIRVVGVFRGSIEQMNEALEPLRRAYPPSLETTRPARIGSHYELLTAGGAGDEDDDGHLFMLHPPVPLRADGQDLTKTCAAAGIRHKVSSAFPKDDETYELIDALVDFVAEPAGETAGRRYVSLHGMGGEGGQPKEDSSYPWRMKPFLAQAQAWWRDGPEGNPGLHDGPNLGWIAGARRAVAGRTAGAFISFPDEAQDVSDYYGDSYGRLRDIKESVDPTPSRLRFPLSLAIDQS